MAKVDIHCHSLYSDQPIHWLFRKLGARESYTPVMELYHRLKSLGMDFVTITDHNRIDGAVELASKYSDCFISCEYTVDFPKEAASIHLCTYDITEEQYRKGLSLCHNIFDFSEYFRGENVLVGVPHPFHCNRGKLELRHLELTLLLFDYFEEQNGLQMETANRMQRKFFDGLTPGFIEVLEKKHGLKAYSPEAWKKGRLGGSDDHSSFFLGACWTEVDKAESWKEFLQAVREKRSSGHGQSMTAIAFSQATQSNWINAILDRYCKPGSFDERLVKLVSRVQPQSRTRKIINRLFPADTIARSGKQAQSAIKRFLVKKMIRLRLLHFLYSQKRFLKAQAYGDIDYPVIEAPIGTAIELKSFKSRVNALVKDWRDSSLLFNRNPERNLQQETFEFISQIFNTLYRYSFSQWFYHLRTGNIPEAFAKLSLIIPGIMPAVPYIMGYKHIFYDNKYLNDIGEHYGLNNSLANRPEKWGWFTDTLMDINGAAQIIHRYNKMAKGSAVSITTITSHPESPHFEGDFLSFPPLFHFRLPEYEIMTLAIPPILDVLRHCEQQGYSRLIISSPGPVGLLGLFIADLLNIPASGIYHTDVPSYTSRLTKDPGMEQLAWLLIRLFYSRMERVYVLSQSSRDKLVNKGIAAEKIRLFAKGTDVNFFQPGQSRYPYRKEWGFESKIILLYVGRVSREKDLDILKDSYASIKSLYSNTALVVVGDGPYLRDMKAEMSRFGDVVFTGFIEGESLVDIYRSCDIFAFPSTTDTYGTAVLEAQASGLPTVVSDQGGPQEVIVDGETGLISKGREVESFSNALISLVSDEELRHSMGKKARAHVEHKTWQNAFNDFIQDHLGSDAAEPK